MHVNYLIYLYIKFYNLIISGPKDYIRKPEPRTKIFTLVLLLKLILTLFKLLLRLILFKWN